MVRYAIGIDSNASSQDAVNLAKVCQAVQNCGHEVKSLGVGPGRVQSFGLSGESAGYTAVYIANGVGISTPADLMQSYYHYDNVIWVIQRYLLGSDGVASDENILHRKISASAEPDVNLGSLGVSSGQYSMDEFAKAYDKFNYIIADSPEEIGEKICKKQYGVSGSSSSSEQQDPSVNQLLMGKWSYEDLISEICNGIDLLFLCKRNHPVCTDYETLFAEARYLRTKYPSSVEGENIKLWQIEDGSYDINVDQYGFYNTVVVKYRGGEVKESFDDLVDVYGEVKIEYKDNCTDKETAIMKAKSYLAAHLREFNQKIDCSLIHDGDIDIGDIVCIDNPMTRRDAKKPDDPEYLFVNGINVDWDDGPILCDLELLYGPESPERPNIPTVAGAAADTGGSGGASEKDFADGDCGDGSMTYEQAWNIAKTWGYGGLSSHHDINTAWSAMGVKQGINPDCFRCCGVDVLCA